MIEKTLYLEGLDPINIYGVNNVNYDFIKQYFPKIKIVARGNDLKVMGEESEIVKFEIKLNLLIDYYNRYNHLTESNIRRIMMNGDDEVRQVSEIDENVIIYGNTGKPIKAQTINQLEFVRKYETNDLLLAIGPAGTGKTYTAIALAVRALRNREVKRIILSRPAVEAEEHLGFLPGDMKDKLDPYLQPLYDALNDMIPAKKLAEYMRDNVIQIAPLAFMRGRTLANAVVILDEGQNATTNQLKMFLTRMGLNSKFIVTGDITQIDLPKKNLSGLLQVNTLLRGIEGIAIVAFDERDIVRHHLVKHIVNAYNRLSNSPVDSKTESEQASEESILEKK